MHLVGFTTEKSSRYFTYRNIYLLKFLHFAFRVHLCGLYGSQKKQCFFPYEVVSGPYDREGICLLCGKN